MPRLYQATPRVTFSVLAAAAAAFALMQSLVTPVLPTIQQDLHTTTGTVTWVLTAWLLAASVATPLMGRIADLTGKDRALLVALAAIAVGCLLAAVAPNVTVLIVARVIQGLGGAIFPVSFGIVRDVFPPARVSSAIGVLAAVIATGGGLGIVLAGPIVGALSWRWLFWLPMVVVIGVGLLAWRLIPRSPVRTPGRVNWVSAALLSGWLVALLLPLSKAAAWGWAAPRTLGLFAAAVVLFAAWLVAELRSGEPLIDLRMMRLPAVWTANLVALLFGAAMFGVFAFLPQLMQIPVASGYGFGASVGGAGLLMLPMLVTMAVFGSLSGPLTRWAGSKAQLLWGAGLSAPGHPVAGAAARRAVGGRGGRRPVRHRARPGLLVAGQPDRGERAAPPDGRGQRNEHEHPDDRRLPRHGDRQLDRHRSPRRPRTAGRVRLHHVVPGAGGRGHCRFPGRPARAGRSPRARAGARAPGRGAHPRRGLDQGA
jgi:MFS family permease